jgi:hypothetical protein
MTKYLKPAFLLTLGALALSTLALTAASYKRIFEYDLSTHGTNWARVHVRDGTILIAYVAADAPPRLNAISPPSVYGECVWAYTIDSMHEKAMRPLYADEEKRMLEAIRKKRQEFLSRPVPNSATAEQAASEEKAIMNSLYEETKQNYAEVERSALREMQSQRLFVTSWVNRVCKPKSFAGFFVNVDSSPREVVLRIPLAAFILLFGLAPMVAIFHRMRIRSRRMKENLCLTCGYNLTGNLSGTCPECGTQIAPHRLI